MPDLYNPNTAPIEAALDGIGSLLMETNRLLEEILIELRAGKPRHTPDSSAQSTPPAEG